MELFLGEARERRKSAMQSLRRECRCADSRCLNIERVSKCVSSGKMARNEGDVLLSRPTVALLLRPGRGADIAISLSLCLSASMYIEPLDRSSPIFCASLRPWLPLSPSLVALRYVMYFRFRGRRHVWP